MSALRQMLASLWAALWVGWRVGGVRVRRMLGRRPRATVASAPGPSFYLPAAEIPVDGVDYDRRELPADLAAELSSVRAELVGAACTTAARPAARRRKARRRRTASVATASLLTLAVLGTGAAALVTGSTGVPAVDRLLGIYEEGSTDPGAAKRPGPSGGEIQPRGSGSSASVSVNLGDGSTIVSTAYVARSGDICVGLVDGDGSGATGDVHCVSPSELRGHLRRYEGLIFGFRRYGSTVVLNGLVSNQVVRLQGRDRPVVVSRGGAWTPEVSGIGELAPFIGVGEGEANTFLRTTEFGLEVRTADGRRTALDDSP